MKAGDLKIPPTHIAKVTPIVKTMTSSIYDCLIFIANHITCPATIAFKSKTMDINH